MKRTLFILSISLFPLLCSAEVYNCNGTWSSKSCGVDSQPVQNLRGLSRIELDSQKPKTEPAKAIPVKTSQPDSKQNPEMECIAVPAGANVGVLGLSARRAGDSDLTITTLVGTVRNNGEKGVDTPIYARLRNSDGTDTQYLKIGDSLIPGETVRFALPMKATSEGQRHVGNFTVQLIYKDPGHCNEYKVSTEDASVRKGFTSNESRGFGDPTGKGFRLQLLESQRKIEEAIKDLRAKFRTEDFEENDNVVGERTRIQSQLNYLCAQNGAKHFSQVADNCFRLDRLIKEIGR